MTRDREVDILDLQNEVNNFLGNISSKENKMEVVIAGNVKAGKSTLINALFNDPTLCSVGVIRTTITNQLIEADQYRIIDTPGINAKNEDTEIAKQGYDQADFFLFVHNIVEGELLAQELNFLKEIRSYYSNDEQFIRNVIIVLTNIHQLEEEALQLVKEKLQKQLQLVTELVFVIFEVDSISYLTALADNKQLLMQKSQIQKLQQQLEQSALEFKANLMEERLEMNSVKKEAILDEIGQYDGKLHAKLTELQATIIDTSVIKQMLEQVKKFPNELSDLLNFENIEKIGSIGSVDMYGYIEVSGSSLYSRYDYKSDSQAESAGMSVLRDKIIPKAEKVYISKRRDIIDAYRNLLPNFAGEESMVTKVQNEIEYKLSELKKALLPLANVFNLLPIANLNTTLSVTLQDASDTPALNHSSTVYASGFEYDYYVESASWYKSYINTNYTIEYKSGMFGSSKEIEKYNFDAYEAKNTVEEHLTNSIKSAKSSVQSDCRSVYKKYEQVILTEVKNIISVWTAALEGQLKSGGNLQSEQQQNIKKLQEEIQKINSLRQKLQ